MGNDLKLPSANRRGSLEPQECSEAEVKRQLKQHIQKVADQISEINNQINTIEHKLKVVVDNTQYYKNLVTDMSKTLLQIQTEQVDESLKRENYEERAKWCFERLVEIEQKPERDKNDFEHCLDVDLAELEANIHALKMEIAENEKYISEKVDKLF